jgi:glutamine cyclotransferase
MDADVEMVQPRSNEVGPAEELYSISLAEARINRQNRCFATAMVSFLVAMIFFISNQYQDQLNLENVPLENGEGEIPEGVNNSVVAEGATMLKPFRHKSHHSINNSTAPTTDPNVHDLQVKQWLKANVTLEDGVKFVVVKQLSHDKQSFTEGLTYANGVLYESVGMNDHSAVLVLDPATGDTLERYDMGKQYFAEGLTYVDGKLIQLTYKEKTGFVYNTSNLKQKPQTFKFQTTTGEGWGLTYDPVKHELIVSDGSEFLHFWDPDTFQEKRKVAVRYRQTGVTANNINELEYWRGRVIANIWYRDILLVINQESGIIEKEYGRFGGNNDGHYRELMLFV